MWYNVLLDVLPYDGYRKPIIIVPDRPETVIDSVTTTPAVADTANVNAVADTAAAAQDFVAGAAPSGDDMTMLWASVFVVFMALALCVWFAYSYRRSLTAKLK